MNKKWLGIIIIVLILGVSAYFYYDYNKQNSQPEILQIDTELEMNEIQSELYDQLKQDIAVDPEDYSARFKLGRLKQDLLDKQGAIEIYEELLQENPEDIAVLQNMADMYYSLKNYEKAEELNLQILEITPKWVNAYRNLLMIYQFQLQDKKEKFADLLDKALEKAPELKNDLLGIGVRYYDDVMNNKEKTIEYLEEKLKVDPDDSVAKQRLQELR